MINYLFSKRTNFYSKMLTFLYKVFPLIALYAEITCAIFASGSIVNVVLSSNTLPDSFIASLLVVFSNIAVLGPIMVILSLAILHSLLHANYNKLHDKYTESAQKDILDFCDYLHFNFGLEKLRELYQDVLHITIEDISDDSGATNLIVYRTILKAALHEEELSEREIHFATAYLLMDIKEEPIVATHVKDRHCLVVTDLLEKTDYWFCNH